MNILQKIQSELKAPKGQVNKFGNYKYRSCEDIVEAVKPIISKYGYALILSDEITIIGERYYVKATAKLIPELEGDRTYESHAYAREQESKKGMDEAQITGSASSYARKYAMNGLFAIDDTKDADTMKPADNEGHRDTKDADTMKPSKNEGHRFKPGEKEQIITQVVQCLENGDSAGLEQILSEYQDPEEKMKVWALFNSQQRAAIKELASNH